MTAVTAAAWRRADTVALVAVTLVAGVLRAVRMTTPDRIVFDEDFYVQDACLYVSTPEECDRSHPFNTEHPPLGKWLIAVGIKLFGYDVFGWRISSVVAGTLTVALLYLLGRRLLGSTFAATAAAGFLAVDPLHFVLSRVAMLDVFVTLFGLAAILFCVYDRDERRRAPPASRRERLLGGKWRIATGVAGGAAVACKWSGALMLVAAILLVAVWDVARRREEGGERPVRAMLRETGPSIALVLVALPVALYLASYLGQQRLGSYTEPPWSRASWYRAVIGRQKFMLRYHFSLEAEYPWTSPAWSWPLAKRPVLFHFSTVGDRYREILSLGNPVTWWPALIGLGAMAWTWLRRRSVWAPEFVVLVGFAVAYGPWLVLTSARSFSFIFYLLPALPFLGLALGRGLERIRHRTGARVLVGGWAAAALAFLVFYYPLVAAVPVSYRAWDQRIVFQDCDRARSTLPALPGMTRPRLRPPDRPMPPPSGWCWI